MDAKAQAGASETVGLAASAKEAGTYIGSEVDKGHKAVVRCCTLLNMDRKL